MEEEEGGHERVNIRRLCVRGKRCGERPRLARTDLGGPVTSRPPCASSWW